MPLVSRESFGSRFHERRRHERLTVALPGRYMLRDHKEYPCWTINVSPAGIAARGQQKGLIGERVVFYIDQIGRLEGMIARNFDTWFAAKLHLPSSKCEWLKETLASIIGRDPQGALDDRLHPRVKPFRGRATLTMPDGRQYLATLVDLSSQGAALNVDVTPSIGSLVTIGQTSARVVRQFATGIAIEFDEPLAANAFALDS